MCRLIRITDHISIGDDEVAMDFIRASGPGGQKVNKASTAVQLRFDVAGSPSLPDDVRARLIRLGGSRVTGAGVLILEADRHRTQKANRADAMARLAALISRAARRPRKRRPTSPTAASRQKRLERKKRHGLTKRRRRGLEA